MAVPATADPGSVASKQSQAQQVLGQIQSLDANLGRAVESYNYANVKLASIEHELKVNAHELVVAKGNLKQAQAALASRLVAIYTSGNSNSTLEVLLGSTSLDDLLNRIDSVNRVSDQDTLVLKQVVSFRSAVQRHAGELKRAHAEQARIVAQRAAQKASIESQLAQRRQLLSSIKGEIARLKAAEAAQQRRLEAAARARLSNAAPSTGQVEASVVGVAAASPEGAIVAPPSRYGGVVGIAMRYLGTPYVWGGASPSGFDCSGFIMYVYSEMGVSLPHSTYALYGMGVPVSKDQLQAGDLVFFDGLGHAGIYVGGGQFIHSPHSGDVVKISSLGESWYAATYVGARRIL